MMFAVSFCFLLFVLRFLWINLLSPGISISVWVSYKRVGSIGIGVSSIGISTIVVGISISLSLGLSISRSLSVVSKSGVSIAIWSVSVVSVESISISLWLSISRSLSIVSIGVWVSIGSVSTKGIWVSSISSISISSIQEAASALAS